MFLSSAMFVGASAAWHLLRGNDSPAIRKNAVDGDVDGAAGGADPGGGGGYAWS
ncbi:hypothetical protein MJ563_10970 [Klebsiella pneumoniae]|nr:hypothetical protein MJ563_10970 [Klebsiella pneumoniae]